MVKKWQDRVELCWVGREIDRHQDSSAFDEFRQPLNRDLPSFYISPVTLLLGLYT